MKYWGSICAAIALYTALFSSACDKSSDGPATQVLERHAVSCAWDSLCNGSDLDSCIRHSAHIEALQIAMFPEMFEPTMQCIESAESCDDYWSCRFGANPEACDPATYATHCEGSLLVRCRTYGINDQYAAVMKVDCTVVDAQCLETDFGAICTAGTCTQSTCDGNQALSCDDGYAIAVDCSRLDSVCEEGACVDHNAASCTQPTCEDGMFKECYDGKTLTWDCAELLHKDSSCVLDHGDPACGKPADQQDCDRSVAEAWCDGNVANICVYGMLATVDCSKYDGARCEAGQYAILCTK